MFFEILIGPLKILWFDLIDRSINLLPLILSTTLDHDITHATPHFPFNATQRFVFHDALLKNPSSLMCRILQFLLLISQRTSPRLLLSKGCISLKPMLVASLAMLLFGCCWGKGPCTHSLVALSRLVSHWIVSARWLYRIDAQCYMLQAPTARTYRWKRSYWRDSDPGGPNDTAESSLQIKNNTLSIRVTISRTHYCALCAFGSICQQAARFGTLGFGGSVNRTFFIVYYDILWNL